MTTSQYNQCVELYSDGVYRFILHNIRDKDDAKDVVQDTFEKLWKSCANVDYTKAKSYIYTTAHHTMIDRIRRSKKQGSFDEVNELDHVHDSQYNDVHELVNKAVQRLPDVQREVIVLRDYEGYDYKEIGKITGLSESQVKVYIYRARIALKQYLGSMANII